MLLLLLSQLAPRGGAIGTMGGGADGMRIDERRRDDQTMVASPIRRDEDEWSRNKTKQNSRKSVRWSTLPLC